MCVCVCVCVRACVCVCMCVCDYVHPVRDPLLPVAGLLRAAGGEESDQHEQPPCDGHPEVRSFTLTLRAWSGVGLMGRGPSTVWWTP